MRARIARHAVVLSLVVAALAASGAAQWSGSAHVLPLIGAAGIALR
ncbi:MAG TPA: hypothetical protein VII06_19080 [Chloroflexota bacterium]|jgi:hypothetical protein